jgi:hypothetical protein
MQTALWIGTAAPATAPAGQSNLQPVASRVRNLGIWQMESFCFVCVNSAESVIGSKVNGLEDEK